MQSNNPILTRVETYSDLAEPMTIQGAIQKSVLLTVIAAVLGMALFFYCAFTANLSIAYAAAIVGAASSRSRRIASARIAGSATAWWT